MGQGGAVFRVCDLLWPRSAGCPGAQGCHLLHTLGLGEAEDWAWTSASWAQARAGREAGGGKKGGRSEMAVPLQIMCLPQGHGSGCLVTTRAQETLALQVQLEPPPVAFVYVA